MRRCGRTQEMARNLNTSAPEMVPLTRAPQIFGLSRSALYRLAAAGKIRMLKMGVRTLLDAGSVREFLATLPVLQARHDPRRTKWGE